jgi:diguanylate cyclase (GGDEF)-like protein
LLDIDQLKQINEESGHYAGDQVIKGLSAFLLDSCRQSDVIGRLSGKEFLLILPETEVGTAYMVAEKWRASIDDLNITVDGVDIDFTCSIGVSGLGNEDRFEILLKKVEANLQQAKISGGNQVVSNDQY